MIKNLTKNITVEGFTKAMTTLIISIMIVGLFNIHTIIVTDHGHKALIKEYVKPEITEATAGSSVGFSKFLSDIEVESIEEVETIEEPVINLSDYEFELTGYVTAGMLNIRTENNTESEVLERLVWNDKINYSIYDENWGIINFNDEPGFIYLKYISDTISEGIEIPVTGDKRKSFMGYKKITDRSSKQYSIQCSSVTDETTGVRMYKERYCVAVGSGYGAKVGQYVDITLKNGTVIPCVISDAKKNIDTNSTNTIGNDGSAIEFVVDTNVVSKAVMKSGDLSDALPEWNSTVVSIEVYDKKY